MFCALRTQYLNHLIDDLAWITNCGVETVKANGYINAKTNLKKLQFGPEKCHKIHVGKKKLYCPELSIDNWKLELKNGVETKNEEISDIFDGDVEMEESHEEKYLGDIVTDDGTNKKNIAARKGKGFGIIERIIEMLQEISFGNNYFEVANLLRHSLFLSSILLNSEAWYNVSPADIEQLEIVDQSLIRRILEAPCSTPTASLYLEMGCLPIRYIIKTRRIMYLHYILNQEENSLLVKFFQAQKDDPVKGDWTNQVQSDMKDIGLELTMNEIKSLSKDSFRNTVKKAVEITAVAWLLSEKAKKSKLKELEYEKLECQNYLRSSELETREKKLLFQIRTRMIDVKANFKNHYSDIFCPLGCENEDDQTHVLHCKILLQNNNDITTCNVEYSDIFHEDISRQVRILRIFNKLWKIRRNIMIKGGTPLMCPR